MKTVYQNCLTLILAFSTFFASAQTPVLNSYPASSNVIFLDFDGHTVTGTSWNSNGAIVCDASTLDAPQITTIFNRVAEDYRPFTVNVTTDSSKYFSAPANRRMRVILTVSSSWYGSAGGVAYINSFNWGDNTPCFVFTALLNNNTKNIAEAASHEIGHTLGLRHQSSYDAVCNKLSEYNPGKGSGEIGWAPIMGVGYYQNMTLWNYGANPFGCNNYQDDLSIITSADNGISYRTDDHAANTSDATTAGFINNSFIVNGIVERPNDVDVIKFTTTGLGQFSLDALPYSIGGRNTGSNIDMEIELLNSAGSVIDIYNAENTLNTSFDTILIPDTYYLRVQGKGNMYAPNYASLGSYTLSAVFTPANALAVHKLQLKGIVENKQHKLEWEIAADEKVVAQMLETSANGTAFQQVTSLGAAARNYNNTSSSNGLVYYRLKITMENGRQYYSNIIALRNNGSNSKPYLIGNIITGTITISSPSAYTYTIYDAAGRTITKGVLTQGINHINPALTNNVYIIQYQNDSGFYTEKFSKQ
jgi:hypothetical protein